MKKIYMLLIAVVIVVMIAMTGKYAGLFAVTSDGTVIPDGENINVPAYGSLTCELSKEGAVSVPSYDLYYFNSEILKCANAYSLNEGCTVTIVLPSKEDVKGLLFASFTYTVCTEGVYCNTEEGQETIFLRDTWITTDHVDEVLQISLTDNQYIRSSYNIKEGLNKDWKVGNKDVGMKYRITPYKIYRDDAFSRFNGMPLDNSYDCVVDGNIDEANLLIEGINGDGDLERDLDVSPYLNLNNLRQKGATAVYLSNIVSVVPDYKFFDDGSKYCYDKRIYTVEEVITTGGVYSIAEPFSNNYINVECCNDMDAGPGYACNSDFEKIPASEEEQCSVFDPCTYAGGVYTADNLYMYQDCIDNKCVTQAVTIECGFDSDCDGGICIKDTNNPENNRCEAVNPNQNCGNGYCELTFLENSITCPQDCDPDYQNKDNTMLILAGIGAFLIITLVVLKKQNNKGGAISFN